jgi:hypothetical protein
MKPGDMTTTTDFVKQLVELSALRNPETGEILKNADGTIVTDGTVEKLLDNLTAHRDGFFRHMADRMAKSSDPKEQERGENALAALDILQQTFGQGKKESEIPSDLPEQVRQELEQNRAERARLSEEKAQAEETKWKEFEKSIMDLSSKEVDTVIDSMFTDTSLSDFTKTAVRDAIRAELFKQFSDENSQRGASFMAKQNQIAAFGMTERAKKEMIAHYKRSAAAIIKSVAEPIMKQAGVERVNSSKAKADKIASQTAASRAEPRSGTAPALPRVQSVDEKGLLETAKQQLFKETGRPPDTADLLRRWNELKAKQATQSVA